MVLLLASVAHGATYYVDGTLADDCDGTNSYYDVSTRTRSAGAGQIAWNDLASANSTLVAGDTVYIRGGTEDYQVYNVTTLSGAGEGIQPDNSGTDFDHLITYSTYQNEKVHLLGDADVGDDQTIGIWIYEKDYIKVTGISAYNLKISKMSHNICIGNKSGGDSGGSKSEFNEVCYIWSTDNLRDDTWARALQQSNAVWKNSMYNHIHHCKFTYTGWMQEGVPPHNGDIFWVGTEAGNSGADTNTDNFNVIEDCEFAYGGHSTFGLHSAMYTVVRNNYIHNEPWFDYEGTDYSYRNIICDGYYGNAGNSIFENNRVGYASHAIGVTSGGQGAKWGLSDCIIRYNSWLGNTSECFGFYPAYGKTKSNYNYLYNNTFFHNGYENLQKTIRFARIAGDPGIPWSVVYGNVLKNNLFHDDYSIGQYDDVYTFSNGTYEDCVGCGEDQGCNVIGNGWDDWADDDDGDPLFVNESMADKTSWILPNFNLQSGSGAIDQGTYLTQANGASDGDETTSTTLIVDDANYFQDGKFGSASGCDPTKWPPSVDIQADWIAIGTVTNTVQISSINYTTNTITLASPMAWADNAPVWLYKKSDGKVVLYNCPDMGAYEHIIINAPQAPQNVIVVPH